MNRHYLYIIIGLTTSFCSGLFRWSFNVWCAIVNGSVFFFNDTLPGNEYEDLIRNKFLLLLGDATKKVVSTRRCSLSSYNSSRIKWKVFQSLDWTSYSRVEFLPEISLDYFSMIPHIGLLFVRLFKKGSFYYTRELIIPNDLKQNAYRYVNNESECLKGLTDHLGME